MLFIRKLTSRNNIALLFLLKLLLLALLLMLPPLNLVLRVVCHDALFVNTTVCSIASKAAALRPVPKKTNGTTYNPFNFVSGSLAPSATRVRGRCWSRLRLRAPSQKDS
jgi:hypothetical protein